SSMIDSFVRLFVFSSFAAALPPASLGGLIRRTVALPDQLLSSDPVPFPVRVLFFARDPLLEPKMLVPPSEPEPPEPFVLPSFGSSFELKNGSSPHDDSSAGAAVPSCRASIATMMFSFTPARLSLII